MAIYNVEEYLEEAIKSVVNQTLSFEKHVQLILVNDGSPDNSERICLKYQQKYPNNVVYVKKENGGVSSARNEGLKHVQGKYVNFLDPDDKLSENTLHEVFVFFEKNYEEIDITAIPLFFFEGRNGQHSLNNKFNKKTRVINILDEYDKIQLSSSSTFIKEKELRKYTFNENMRYAEDAELLNKIILGKCALGVVDTAKYFYRKRKDNSSAVQNGENRREWYTNYLKTFSQATINYSISVMGYVPKYIQYMVMYDLQWRLNVEKFNSDVLNDEEQKEFVEVLKSVLLYIDDEIIMQQRSLNIHRKIFALRLKYNESKQLYRHVFLKDNVLLFFNQTLIDSLVKQDALITLLEIKRDKLYIEGQFGSLFNQFNIVIKKGEESYPVNKIDRSHHNIYSLGQVVQEYYGFQTEIPLNDIIDSVKIRIFVEINNVQVPIKLKFTRFSKLSNEFGNSYYSNHNYCIREEDHSLVINKTSMIDKIYRELKFLKELYKSKGIGSKKAILARMAYNLGKIYFRNKKIWLIMDRQDKADDNAEHLFKYALKKNDNIKKYFVIKKDSKDYKRLLKLGPVIPFGSYKHKLWHLLADKIISSHHEEQLNNPFLSLEKYYRDIMDFDFIFLQHGITKDDVSPWLNKYKKNFKMFVTSAYKEYESIINGSYGYNKLEVKLTGFPRFDGLENNDKGQVLIMPTWRMSLVKEKNMHTGKRPYNETFKDSIYFKMYNKLINDDRLIAAAKEKGYNIIFYPHPEISQQIIDFDRNDYIKFADFNTRYQSLFNESSMLITDYSSVAFDVAYLKKPVLYFHFDKNHYGDGYFNYETMGFGEICYDYECLINQVVEYINNNCRMKDKYIKRVENFYAFTDKNNCQRVYNEIIKLD